MSTDAARSCENCGAEMQRLVHPSGRLERPGKFALRRYCSRACLAEAQLNRTVVRMCEQCGRPLERKERPCGALETPSAYVNRRFCDASCRDKAKLKQVKPRHCERCGAEISRTLPGGKWLSPTDYRQRKYCSQACAEPTTGRFPAGRTCEACGQPIVRQRYPSGRLESPNTFAARKTCGRQCAATLSRRPVKQPVCQYCEQPIERCKGQTITQWEQRRFCSRQCYRLHHQARKGTISVSRQEWTDLVKLRGERRELEAGAAEAERLASAHRQLLADWVELERANATAVVLHARDIARKLLRRYVRRLDGLAELPGTDEAIRRLRGRVEAGSRREAVPS